MSDNPSQNNQNKAHDKPADSTSGVSKGKTSRKPGYKPHSSKSNTEFWKHEVFWFMVIVVIICVGAYIRMERANDNMEKRHALITKSIDNGQILTNRLLAVCRTELRDSTLSAQQISNILATIEETHEKIVSSDNDERTNDLLEIELAKIQNEYEVLNLWCALLTVVFLIFSFFSIFKTNEMSNQASEALSALKRIQKEAQEKTDNIDQKVNDAEKRINKKETKLLKSITSKISKLKEDLKPQEKRQSEIDSKLTELSSQISDEEAKLKTLDEARTEFYNSVKSIVDKIKESLGKDISENIEREGKMLISTEVAKIRSLESELSALQDSVELLKQRIEAKEKGNDSQIPSEVDDVMPEDETSDIEEEDTEGKDQIEGESPDSEPENEEDIESKKI